MRLPQPLALQPPAWDSGTASAGPATTVLARIIARVAIILRAVALAEMIIQVIIWHSFYLASPWLFAGPAVAFGWGCTSIGHLRRHRPNQRFICADTAMYAAIALGAAWCVPPAIRGDAGSWRFILVASQLITPVWFAPQALSVPLTFTPVAAFAAGTALAPSTSLVTADPRNQSVALLCIVAAGHLLLRRMLSGRATSADAALAAADRGARDQYVNLSENIERREQDRLLHDTVLNTLTAIARSGSATAVAQCRQDIAMLERALSESAGAGPAGGTGPGPLAAIAAVVSEMRARGLTVDLELTDDARGEPGLPSIDDPEDFSGHRTEKSSGSWKNGGYEGGDPAPVPGPVAAAMAHATREALANVAAHAGTGKAWVRASLTPQGVPGGAGQLRVTIRDAGAGFDVGGVAPARLGVRRSITERVEDWGGSATVRSAPGEGTTVCLSWPAARPGSVPAPVFPPGPVGSGQVPGQW
jgi:signal transduction histidine kinase